MVWPALGYQILFMCVLITSKKFRNKANLVVHRTNLKKNFYQHSGHHIYLPQEKEITPLRSFDVCLAPEADEYLPQGNEADVKLLQHVLCHRFELRNLPFQLLSLAK